MACNLLVAMLMVTGTFAYVGEGFTGPVADGPETGQVAPDQMLGVAKTSDNSGILVDFDVPDVEWMNHTANGTSYRRAVIPNEGSTMEVGKPELPMIGRFVEVPEGVSLSVEVVHSEYTLMDTFVHVFPVQGPWPDISENISLPFAMDTALYSTDAFYPGNETHLGETVVLRGHKIAPLSIYPVQYNPLQKKARVFTKLEVRVVYDRPAQIEKIDDHLISGPFEMTMRAFVINYEPRVRYREPRQLWPPGNEGADYLIITHQDFVEEVEPLKRWKEEKGLITKVVTTNQIATPITESAIVDYIQDAYDNWDPSPTYVLLMGDVEFIPTNYVTDHPYGPYFDNKTATDLYYGTVDGDDHFPDIFVGRMCANSEAEVTHLVEKTLTYERSPAWDQRYWTHTFVAGFFQDNDNTDTTTYNERDGRENRLFVRTSENIRDYLMDEEGYEVQRIYNAHLTALPQVDPEWYNDGTDLPNDLLVDNGFQWDGDTNDIIDEFNAGVFIANHRDHGSRSGWGNPGFHTWDLASLENGDEMPVVFSINCESGWFDQETDHASWTNSESFCEQLLLHDDTTTPDHDGGAVAVFGSTRVSYSWWNDALCEGFYDAIWPEFDDHVQGDPIRKLGPILTYGKVYMAGRYGSPENGGTALVEFEEFHLHGDPEVSIWTHSPLNMTVTHPHYLCPGGPSEFVVKVTGEGVGPLGDALVAVYQPNSVHMSAYTDPNGYARFEVEPDAGELYVTVTEDDYWPYQGSAKVTNEPATVSLSLEAGPPGVSVDVTGSGFSSGESVELRFDTDVVDQVTSSGGTISTTVTVPDMPAGYINVVAFGTTSNRYATTVFQVLPPVPLPDIFLYSQWDDSTWYLTPTSSDPVWNNPDIELFLPVGGENVLVSSGDLEVGTTYLVRAKIRNTGPGAANDATVTFRWAHYGAGNIVFETFGTDTISINGHISGAPPFAYAETEFTPFTTGHVCIRVDAHHSYDSNHDNDRGQENTEVHAIASPATVTFTVTNPTNWTTTILLDVTQHGPDMKPVELWSTRIERQVPQTLKPGESQNATLTVVAPPTANVGDARILTVDARAHGEVVGGVQFTFVKDEPPTLSEANVTIDGGAVEGIVPVATLFDLTVTYTDPDDHAPMNGSVFVSVFREGTAIEGSPFAMEPQDPSDTDFTDGRDYKLALNMTETGNYSCTFLAWDTLMVGATGNATGPSAFEFEVGVPGPVDTEPPQITHTPPTEWYKDEEETIEATITDNVGVTEAMLYYRKAGETNYTSVEMEGLGNDTYFATIPGEVIVDDLEYYLWSTDGTNEAFHPDGAPGTPVSVSEILERDTEPPSIAHTPIGEWWIGEDKLVEATIADNVAVKEAHLLYRVKGPENYTSIVMTSSGDDKWVATIPGAAVTDAGVQYYFRASDGESVVELPDDHPDSPFEATAKERDVVKPVITIDPPTKTRTDKDLVITLEATDDVAVTDVKLYYRQDEGSWTTVQMAVDGDTYTGTIPKGDLKEGDLFYYVLAEDEQGNVQSYGTESDPKKLSVKPPDDGPGFGLLTTVTAITLLAAMATRRRDRQARG